MKFILFCFFTCTILFAENNTQTLRSSFTLPQGREIHFTVLFETEYTGWAGYTAQKTEDFIKAACLYLDFPFPHSPPFSIQGRKEVWYSPDPDSRRPVRIGGVHSPEKVEVEYLQAPVGKPALLFHELGHYWFGYHFPFANRELHWLIEGIVSFLPFALHRAGKLALTEQENGLMLQHWGMYRGWDAKTDYPLALDRRFEGPESLRHLYYIKSFHIQYLLFLELGQKLYLRFLQELLKAPAAYRKNSEVLLLLSRLKEQDWSKILKGWVFSGEYLVYRPVDLTDYDTDGLPGITELLSGTSPVLADTDGDRLPDGFEQFQGLNPLKADSQTAVKSLIRAHGLWADGCLTDWTDSGYRQLFSPATVKRTAYAFTELRLTVNGEWFFIALATSEPLPRTRGIIVDLLVDLNNDRQSEKEYVFELHRPDFSWIYYPQSGESVRFTGMVTGLGKEGCEYAIPLALLGRKQLAVLPVIYDLAGKFHHSKWQHWVQVDIPLLSRLAGYDLRTNLEDDDADQDGIPDLAELQYALDPLNACATEELSQYGPFVDGRGQEWQVLPAIRVIDEDKQEPIGPYDILGLYYIIRQETLYLFLPFADQATWKGTPDDMTCDIIVDLNGDHQADREFVFYLNAPQVPWVYTKATKSSITPAGLKTALKEGAEFAIPLSLIGQKSFRLYPIIWDMKKKITREEFPGWIEVNLK